MVSVLIYSRAWQRTRFPTRRFLPIGQLAEPGTVIPGGVLSGYAHYTPSWLKQWISAFPERNGTTTIWIGQGPTIQEHYA